MRARVKNGRWVLDEPADLPEGTVVEIITRAVPVPGEVYMDPRLHTYVQLLLVAACSPKYSVGRVSAQPKDEMELIDGAKANARSSNRTYATVEDIKAVAAEVLRRFVVVPPQHAGVSADVMIKRIFDETAVP